MTRLAFLGSPVEAATVLSGLHSAGHEIALVVTMPERRRSRRSAPEATPVGALAAELGLSTTADPSEVATAGVELGVVVAYGRILRKPLIDQVPLVNLHFSLLPRWRGAAPVERAILAGDEETGVCLMAIEEGLDTGPVYGCRSTAISPGEHAGPLRERLSVLGTQLLVARLESGLGTPVAQHGTATHAAKIDKDERRLEWSEPSEHLERVVRVGRAFSTWRGRRVIVESATVSEGPPGAEPGTLVGDLVATGEGWLRLVQLRGEGRTPQGFGEWARGSRPLPGERFGD